MSGFVGIVQSDGEPIDRALLGRLTEAMSHCGPDRREVWLDGHVGLGHALLAATPEQADLERQPRTRDGRVWIAADARIDGREDLALPDAEAILQAYQAWGENCVDHLIGDFAFAIWDGDRQRLFCARDHFGVVPFYYARAGGGIVFGNVLQALRLHPAVSAELDERAVGDFLLFGRNMDLGTTIFADLRTLPPAHVLTWEDGMTGLRRYWEPAPERRSARPEDHLERFGVLFDRAVGDRLRSNRAGTHLSGGMDSTSVAVTANHVLESRSGEFDLRAYTVVFEGLAEEEGRYADGVAARAGLRREHIVGDRYVTRTPKKDPSWALPEPGESLDNSALYEVAKRVSSFSRALLVGMGGDPLFSAPHVPRFPRYGVRTALRRWLRSGRPRIPPLPNWIDPGFARLVDLPTRWHELNTEWDRVWGPRAMLHPLWPSMFAASHPGASGLPLKVLFPFFDLRLAQCVWELPPSPWREGKRLLREAMRDRLPDAVLERPKTPLYSPGGRVHRDDPSYRLSMLPETRRWRMELLSEGPIGEYVDVERAKALIESPVSRRTVSSFENCFALAQWLHHGLDTRDRLPTSKEKRHVGDPATA